MDYIFLFLRSARFVGLDFDAREEAIYYSDVILDVIYKVQDSFIIQGFILILYQPAKYSFIHSSVTYLFIIHPFLSQIYIHSFIIHYFIHK